MTKERLWKLRNEIRLGSIYIGDYQNDMNIDESIVCNFFDGYIEYLAFLMDEYQLEWDDSTFYDCLSRYDNADNLWNWYSGFDENPLCVLDREKARDEGLGSGTIQLIENAFENALDHADYNSFAQTVFDGLVEPREGQSIFWSDGYCVLSADEKAINCVADIFDGFGYLSCTGYFDPKESDEADVDDKYTGMYYLDV